MKMSEIIGSFRSQRRLEKGMNYLKKRLFDHTKILTYAVFPTGMVHHAQNLVPIHNYLADQEVEVMTQVLMLEAQDDLKESMGL